VNNAVREREGLGHATFLGTERRQSEHRARCSAQSMRGKENPQKLVQASPSIQSTCLQAVVSA